MAASIVPQPTLFCKEGVDRLPGPFGAPWFVAELQDDETKLAAVFERKHGVSPENILPHRGLLWLGPVPEPEVV